MANGFSIVPGSIDAEARAFLSASHDAVEAWQQLQSSLDGLGVVVGNDKLGRTFATRYEADIDTMAENLRRLADSINSVNEGLKAASEGYTGVDAKNAEMMRPGAGP